MWREQGYGDESAEPREMVLPGRVTGKVVTWKGKFGWIQPDSPIQHPQAKNHGGRVFLNQQDVESSIEGVGSAVSFFVYADGSGLGAAKAMPASLGVQKDIHKTNVGGFPSPNGAAQAFSRQAPSKGSGKNGIAARETLTAHGQPVHGRIVSWKGNYGWIKPYDALDFSGFTGDLFLDKQDVEGEVVEGGDVIFHVYRDLTGKLGAESVCSAESGVPSPASAAESGVPSPALVSGGLEGAQDPGANAVPLPDSGDGSREDAPGLYQLLHFAHVKETKSRESKDVARVEVDDIVQVVEIVMVEEEDRLRGRIAEPAGWISLVNTCTGDRWATPLGDSQPKTQPSASDKPNPNLARERITSVPTTGEVILWKSGHGWLMPSEPLEHPFAAKREGRIFIGRGDLASGTTNLHQGQIVQFHVYADSSGLGAEECEQF